jgi:hypothetical protein
MQSFETILFYDPIITLKTYNDWSSNLIILPMWVNQEYPPTNLQCSVFTGVVTSVLLVQIIGNIILFGHMNASVANWHASQDPVFISK